MSVKETADEEAGREKRLSELRVSAILGFDRESWEISEVLKRRDVVRRVVGAIGEFKPTAILNQPPNGKHRLHAEVSSVVSEAAWHAAQLRYLGVGQPVNAKSVYYFEVWDLFTQPNAVVYISSSMDKEVCIRN